LEANNRSTQEGLSGLITKCKKANADNEALSERYLDAKKEIESLRFKLDETTCRSEVLQAEVNKMKRQILCRQQLLSKLFKNLGDVINQPLKLDEYPVDSDDIEVDGLSNQDCQQTDQVITAALWFMYLITH